MSEVKFSGSDARDRAAQKRGDLLRWLWHWTFTDYHVIGQVWGTAAAATRNTIASMEKAGLVKRVNVSGIPMPIVYMTGAGAATAAPLIAGTDWIDVPPVVHLSRLNLRQAQHDLLTQRMIVDINRPDAEYLNDRYCRYKGLSLFDHGKKFPDALVRIPGRNWWAIEVMETMPPPEERSRLLWLHAQAWKNGEIEGTVIGSTHPSFIELMEDLAAKHNEAWIYMNESKRWAIHEHGVRYVTPEWRKSALRFKDLSRYTQTLFTVPVK